MALAQSMTRNLVGSLKCAGARQESVCASAVNAGLAWECLDAYESLHPDLAYREEEAIVAKGRPLTKGEIGCYSSHYEAWRQLVAGEHDQYVVLEDDVIVDWDYLAAFVDRKSTRLNSSH